MSKYKCKECARFDRPRRDGECGWCTQLGEGTSADGAACFWFAPHRRVDNEEKED